MEGTNLRIVLVLGLLVLLAPVAAPVGAAPSVSGTGPNPTADTRTEPEPGKTAQEYQGLGVGQQLTSFAGSVFDIADHPLAGTHVSLFVDGEAVGAAVTDAAGFYELRAPYNAYDDSTVLLWYVSPDRTLMPKALVLRESKASLEHGLISKCLPRASVTPGRQFRVYLFDAANRNKDVAESKCLP